jgi:hypothetical protein
MPQQRKPPSAQPETLKLLPVESRPEEKRVGRKRKPAPPPPLSLPGMSGAELERYDLFLAAYREEYKGQLSNTDNILLELAAIEYIKCLRVMANELTTGETITMARQHPGVQMRAYMDMLSITRKARVAESRGKKEETGTPSKLNDLLSLSC